MGRSIAVVFLLLSLFSFSVFAEEDPPIVEESTLQMLRNQLRQLGYTPKAIARMHAIVREEFSFRVLDANLWAYYGFHNGPPHRHYQMRTWLPVNLGKIEPHQVKGIPSQIFALAAQVAKEIEAPVLEYSLQSGGGFRRLHPNVGRFMGRDPLSAEYARQNNAPWCVSPWCREEERHGDAFARIFRALTGRESKDDNLAPTEVPEETIEYAISHIDSRQAAEWSASGTYLTLLAHCDGDLYNFLRNVFRDEAKHLAIMSAFHAYLHGDKPWRRIKEMMRWTLGRAFLHTGERTGISGGAYWYLPLFLVEYVYAHSLIEIAMRRWLKSLPYSVLRHIFETPSLVPDFLASDPDPSALARWNRERLEGEKFRLQLTLWKPSERAEALERWRFLDENRSLLQSYVTSHLGGFAGAEEPESEASQRMRRRIVMMDDVEVATRFQFADKRAVQNALLELLRLYQFENNYESRTFRGQLAADPNRFNIKGKILYCSQRLAGG